jgi:hypothetical protein
MGNILDAFIDAIELDHLDDAMLDALEAMFADQPYPIDQH